MKKQKSKKGITDAPELAGEQPEEYKKLQKESQETLIRIRDAEERLRQMDIKFL